MSAPTRRTERLDLRAFRDEDLDALDAVMEHPLVRAALHVPDSHGRADTWNQMAGFVGQWELRGTGQWAVEERSSATVVGRAGLHRPERHDWPGVEVGWTLHPDHWGKGFATEAGAASIDYAFDVLGTPEVWALILPENSRSIAVAERLSMELVELRTMAFFPEAPHGLWRVLPEQWHARGPVTHGTKEQR